MNLDLNHSSYTVHEKCDFNTQWMCTVNIWGKREKAENTIFTYHNE